MSFNDPIAQAIVEIEPQIDTRAFERASQQAAQISDNVFKKANQSATINPPTRGIDSLIARLQQIPGTSNNASRALTGLTTATSRLSASQAQVALRVGATATALVGLAAGAKRASDAIVRAATPASTLQESTNAINVTLGEAAPRFRELTKNVENLGISQSKLNQAIVPLASLLRNAGLEGDQFAGSLNDLFRRAVDVSSVFNADVNTVIQAFGGALRGETEQVERFGAAFNALQVEAKAATLGFKAVNGEFDEGAKQQARLALLLEQSTRFTGDFANTSGTLANQQRVLGAVMERIRTEISAQFLPAAQRLVGRFIELARDAGPALVALFENLKPAIDFVAEAIIKAAEAASTFVRIVSGEFEVLGQPVNRTRSQFADMFKNIQIGGQQTTGSLGAAFAKMTTDLKNAGITTESVVDRTFGRFNEILETTLGQQDKLVSAQNAVKSAQDRLTASRRSAVDAAQRLVDAQQSLTDAQARLGERTQALLDLEQERRTLLADTARDIREVTEAEEDLTRIGFRLLDLDEQRADILRQISELNTPATADEIAQADRRIERAKIQLNRAVREERDLLNSLNEDQRDSVDLSGLTLDQLRTQLSGIRASLAAQRAVKKETKSQEQIEEDRLSARLNVVEAEERLKELSQDRLELDQRVIRNQQDIQRLTQQLNRLEFDKRQLLRDQGDAQSKLNNLRAGETTRAQEIRTLDGQILQAKRDQQNASRDIEAATRGVRDAEFGIRDAANQVRDAQFQIRDAKVQQRDLAAQTLGSERDINNALRERFGLNSQLVNQSRELLVKNFQAAIPQLFAGSASLPFALSAAPQLAKKMADLLLTNPNALRDYLRGFGLQGFAEGGVIQGVNSKFGQIIRAGEYGRSEMVLPLQSGPQKVWDLLSKNIERYPSLKGGVAAIAAQQSAPLPKIPIPSSGNRFASESARRQQNKDLANDIADALIERGFKAGDLIINNEVQVPEGSDQRTLAKMVARKVEKDVLDKLSKR